MKIDSDVVETLIVGIIIDEGTEVWKMKKLGLENISTDPIQQ